MFAARPVSDDTFTELCRFKKKKKRRVKNQFFDEARVKGQSS